MQSGLYVVGTPIGNLSDMSPRAIEVLRSVDLIAAEDTRVFAKLAKHFDIKTKVVSCHEHNEKNIVDSLSVFCLCTEVGQYLAMARQADREGYPEVAEAFRRYAFEEADHASRFAELLGEVVWDTKTNLEKRMLAEAGACEDKLKIAKRAKELNLDAIHDTVHEMAKDEARHGKGFEGLFKRYFGK